MKGFSHESTSLSVPVEWYTPPEIFEALNIEFDLDPCSPPAELDLGIVPTRKKISFPNNGLDVEWSGRVWLNPPYGKQTPVWLRKLAMHGNGVALVFSRTDTAWFNEAVDKCNGVVFMTKRVKFINAKTGERSGTPGAGSCLIAYGGECWEAVRSSGLGIPMVKCNV